MDQSFGQGLACPRQTNLFEWFADRTRLRARSYKRPWELGNSRTISIAKYLHSDHYLELGPLIYTAWTAGLKTPIDIYGPYRFESTVTILYSMKDDIDLQLKMTVLIYVI